MSGDIVLVEREEHYARLRPGEARHLAQHHARHLRLRRTMAVEDVWLLTAGQVCGVIPLPSGRVVRIEPRADIGNLWELVAAVEDVCRPDGVVGGELVSGIPDGLVIIYVRALERLLETGLARGYLSHSAMLGCVRGRLDVARQVREGMGRRDRFACEYDEFGCDTAENRLLAAAFDRVEHRARRLLPGPLVARCVAGLSRVRRVRVDGRRPARDRREDRDERYRLPLALAELVLSGQGTGHRAGAQDTPALLVDMPLVYERFVRGTLAWGLPRPLSVRVSGGTTALDEDGRALLNADVVVEHAGRPVCVIDAKYRSVNSGRGQMPGPSADDLYQMLAYCVGYEVSDAVLVYPEPVEGEPLRFRIGDREARIHPLGVDLSGDRSSTRAQRRRLCRRVAEIATRAQRGRGVGDLTTSAGGRARSARAVVDAGAPPAPGAASCAGSRG